MVGVAAHLSDDGDRLVEADAALPEQAHELGNHHRGVGVVNLDGGVVRKVVEVAAAVHTLIEHELRGVAHHEVLLIDAEDATTLVGVVGIEEEREVLGDLTLVKLNAVADDALVDRVDVEETQAPALAPVARDIDVIEGGRDVEAAERDRVVALRATHPALLTPLEPVVGGLVLLPLVEALAEESAVVGEADAVRGETERGAGVDEAGGEPAEATVAERRLVLELLERGEVLAGSRELVPDLVVQAQVDEVVAEQLADEELGGDVVELLRALVVTARARGVGRHREKPVEELEVGAVVEGLSRVGCERVMCHVSASAIRVHQ